MSDYFNKMEQIRQQVGWEEIVNNPVVLPRAMKDVWMEEKDVDLFRVVMASTGVRMILRTLQGIRGTCDEYESQKQLLIQKTYIREDMADRVLEGLWVIAGKKANKRYHAEPVSGKHRGVDSYIEYKKALEDYYIKLGKKPLSEQQIQLFISEYSLSKEWGIGTEEVKRELQNIYRKYTPVALEQKKRERQPLKSIYTYETYMKELKELYVKNGYSMLDEKQIESFLTQYNLRRNFKIDIRDVKSDLKEIAKKTLQPVSAPVKKIDTYEAYMTELERLYLSNGRNMLPRVQIESFLVQYNLQSNFGIDIQDVESDLKEIAKKTLRPVSASVKKIDTYEAYVAELERLYLSNGRNMLSRVQIESFLVQYNLQSNFGIDIQDVESDLRTIALNH